MRKDLEYYTTPVAIVVNISGVDILSGSQEIGENTIEFDDIEF